MSTLVDWEDGNMGPFLRAFPSLCAFIASGHLPKVLLYSPSKTNVLVAHTRIGYQIAPVFIMLLERLVMYDREFPRALEHIGANCTAIDEEFVELLNSKVLLLNSIDEHTYSFSVTHKTHVSDAARPKLEAPNSVKR